MTTILIVEDHALIRELAEITIQGWGHRTLTAGDADEALLLLRSPQDIDLLFTDIYLKTEVFGGYEIAREAISLRPGLRVLYTTGNLVTDEMKAQFLEGTHFLRKPYTPGQLKGSIDDLMAG